jgi:cytochrome c peroxidase
MVDSFSEIPSRHAVAKAARLVAAALLLVAVPLIPLAHDASERSGSEVSSNTRPQPSLAALETLGRKMFFDRDLSASHRMSCATCHDPRHAYGPPNQLPVQMGGPDLRSHGQRAVPSLRYLHRVPGFTEHYVDEDVDETIDVGPTGGLTWDGRAQTVPDQASLPLLSPLEMANASAEQVAATIAAASYADEFRQAFGDSIFDDPRAVVRSAGVALGVFQQNPTEFYPFSSKYDAVLRGRTALSPAEERGRALYIDERKGNCGTCHPIRFGYGGTFPVVSDFGYIAVGVPRNRSLPANKDSKYYDLGLCGPLRQDLADRTEFCGLFRAPTLRNVALRHAFFHNGVFHSLKEVMQFYVERDIHPEKWYPRDARGRVRKYDDLPAKYWKNVNREPPFDRGPGDEPALSAAEIDDVIAFLNTLTDGWTEPASSVASTGGRSASSSDSEPRPAREGQAE